MKIRGPMRVRVSLMIVMILGLALPVTLFAFPPFIVKKVCFEGLQGISESLVRSEVALPLNEELTEERLSGLIKSLYKTGFFETVSATRAGNSLFFRVVERPTIGELVLKGVKDSDKLKKKIKDLGFAAGRIFDPLLLQRARKEIETYYLTQGRYGVRVDAQVKPLPRNQKSVRLDIYEGDVAKVRSIRIQGNRAFSENELMKEFHTQKTGWFSWFSKADLYLKEKVNADGETLRSYYLDHGYLDFQLDSTRISLTPDKQHVYVTFYITEGALYRFDKPSLEGDLAIPKKLLNPLLSPIQVGAPFSRKTILEVKEALENRLGSEGYSMAQVHPQPITDRKEKTVAVSYAVESNKRVYVRRIHVIGNALTKDEVLRRELPQMEGARASTSFLQEGRQKILRRGYATDVSVETRRVENTPDQIDVIYKIEESQVNQFGAGLAYSQVEKLVFNLSMSQNNFLGTGKEVGFNFDNSKASTTYTFDYTDPYFTMDGIGMGLSATYGKTDLSRVSTLTQYATDTIGTAVRWVFPIGAYESFRTHIGYDHSHIKTEKKGVSREVSDFIARHGNKANEYHLGVGWTYDSVDQRIFPHSGLTQSLDFKIAIPPSQMRYYRADYELDWYKPISRNEKWIVRLGSHLGYGHGYGKTRQMPFFRNYTMGGISTVRGFDENALGPKDSTRRTLGGNLLVLGKAALIFPFPFEPDAKSVRTSLFVDVGQVYNTHMKPKQYGDLRYSVGVSLSWHSPLGAPLVFSLAKPLNAKRGPGGEERRHFQFTMGTHL